jgi:two-component system response regulator AtoC
VELTALLDCLPVGVAILDPEARVLHLNRSFETTMGFSREEVLGVPYQHVLRSNLWPAQCPVDECRRAGASARREGDVITRGRTRLPVHIQAEMLPSTSGTPAGFIVALQIARPPQRGDIPLRGDPALERFLGRSPEMERLLRLVPVVAQTDSSILLTGETGTGKDFLAELIHGMSERRKGPFIKVNCGALPEALLESELFGHNKGAFTGAVADRPGRIRLAHTGTLYLTEIGDLPLPLQVKLLTFLDDKVVYPLGSTHGHLADVRVIAATHRDLEQMALRGEFRQDLLFRIHVVRLHIPPLRERQDEIPILLDHFLQLFASRFGKEIDGFSCEARSLLLRYPYPGNVRELRNIVEYATSISPSRLLDRSALPTYLMEDRTLLSSAEALPSGEHLPADAAATENSRGESWSAIERQLIVDALKKAGGRRGRAAELLGWGRTTLWRKMKGHGLEA